MRTFTHAELVVIAHKWVLNNASCGVAFKELSCAGYGEIPDVIGFGSWHSVVIECKVSRSDFLSDKKKHFRKKPEVGMGKKRYYCCPSGLIKQEELPEGWGLIYVTEKGKAIHQFYPTIPNPDYPNSRMNYTHPANIKAENAIMYSALRRLHLRGCIEEIYDSPYTEKNSELAPERSVATEANSLFKTLPANE